MSFLKSVINQVGKDMGKAVSNQIFKDAHATPYRRVGNSANGQFIQRRSAFKSEFDRAINFQTAHRPNTLILKISGVYTVLKNEANHYISDGYLDTNESDNLFTMMKRFNQKVDDVCDILEVDEVGNITEIEQLTKIVEKTNALFKQTLVISAQGCEDRKFQLKEEAKQIENLSFLRFILLTTVWMGKYARTGEKSWGATIFANLLSLLVFPLIHICMFFYGMLTYSGVNSKRKKLKNAIGKMSELEGERAKAYLSIAQ